MGTVFCPQAVPPHWHNSGLGATTHPATPLGPGVSAADTWPGSPQSEEGRGQLGVALGLK